MRWARAACLAALLLATGCGVRPEPEATRIPAEDIPFRLLDPAEQRLDGAQGAVARATIFLVKEGRLAAVERGLEVPVVPERVLRALARGPTEAEAQAGLRSALPDAPVVRSVDAVGGIATVDLHTSFTVISAPDQVLALAQIVYTLTARPGIGRVAFTLEGVTADVPRGDGALTKESLAREDYSAIAPP